MGIIGRMNCLKRRHAVETLKNDDTEQIQASSSSSSNGSAKGKPPKLSKSSSKNQTQSVQSVTSENESFDDEFKRTLAGQDEFDENFENSLDNFDENWPSVNDVVHDRDSAPGTAGSKKSSAAAAANGSIKSGANGLLNGLVANGVSLSNGGSMPEKVIEAADLLEEIQPENPDQPVIVKRNTWSPPGLIED